MKKKSSYYECTSEGRALFMKSYLSKNKAKIDVNIDVILSDDSLIPHINDMILQFNTDRKEKYSEGGKKGGSTRASQESHTKQFAELKTTEHQKKASKKGVEKNRELGNYKAFQEQATKAASIANSKHREDRMMEIINVLPSNIEFGFEEFTIIAEQFNRKWWYIKELNRFYPELVQKAGRGKFIKIV